MADIKLPKLGSASGTGIPKLKPSGTLNGGLPKLGASSTLSGLKKPAKAAKPDKAETPAEPVSAPQPEITPVQDPPAQSSSVFADLTEEEEEEKTQVQSTDDVMSALLGDSDLDSDWSLDDINISAIAASPAPKPAPVAAPPAPGPAPVAAPPAPPVPPAPVAAPPAPPEPPAQSTIESAAAFEESFIESLPDPEPEAPSIPPAPATAPGTAPLSQPPLPTAESSQVVHLESMIMSDGDMAGIIEMHAPHSSAMITEAQTPSPLVPVAEPEEPENVFHSEAEMLNSMTPEERAAYELEVVSKLSPEEQKAYEMEIIPQLTPTEREAYEQAKAIRIENRERERAAYRKEMVDRIRSEQNSPMNKSRTGLVVAIIILVCVVGALIVMFALKKDEEPTEPEQQAESQPVERKEIRSQKEIAWTPIPLEGCDNGAVVYVNGVETRNPTQANFARGYANSVIAYLDGMTPFFASFTEDSFPDKIQCEFKSDELFMKTSIGFKFKVPAQIEKDDLEITFDGKPLRSIKENLHDVVMDVPHTLVIKKPGYAPHLHVVWPTKRPTHEVTIPELQLENNAKGGTLVDIKPFPKNSPEPYGIRIRSGENTLNSPAIVTTIHGEFIDYTISRKQRQTLHFGIYPDAYGTVSLDTELKTTSLGTSGFAYKVQGKKDIKVCLSREGEVHCLDKNVMNPMPSGLGWEVIAYTGPESKKEMLKAGYRIDLLNRRNYTYKVEIGRGNSLDLRQEHVEIIKKENAEKK